VLFVDDHAFLSFSGDHQPPLSPPPPSAVAPRT
jgi:hypothetical protein